MYTEYDISKKGDEIVIIVDLGKTPTKLEDVIGSYKLNQAYFSYLEFLKKWGYIKEGDRIGFNADQFMDVESDKEGNYYFTCKICPKETIKYNC